MPATYEPISTTTLGSAASSITFSSIPGTYTDLRLVLVGTTTTSGGTGRMRYNSDTGSNYSYTALAGYGTSAISFRDTGNTYIDFTGVDNLGTTNPTFYTFDIFSYAGSTNKTSLITTQDDQNGSGGVGSQVALWRSTAAITSISLDFATQTFKAGTTATLYGILRAT